MYQPRFYREKGNQRLKKYNVCYKETDLLIYAKEIKDLASICFETVRGLRLKLEHFIEDNPVFKKSLLPLKFTDKIPVEIKQMISCSNRTGVGPMATVAGIFAEKVGKKVLEITDEVIVENGGDLFVAVNKECRVRIFPGKKSSFNDKMTINIKSELTPLGICSSSGTMGPSLSKGKADLVTVLSASTPLADAAATAIANRIKTKEDIPSAMEWGCRIEGIIGLIIIKDDKIGAWGEVEFI